MSSEEVIQKLKERLGYDESKCLIIKNILDDYLMLGNHKKDRIISRLVSVLHVDENEADRIYETTMEIIGSGANKKFWLPFHRNDR